MIELNRHVDVVEPGDILTLYHTQGLSDCRAVPLMLRMYADMIDNGHNGDYSVYLNNEHEIVWAEYNEKPIGGIYFIVKPDKGIAWNTFSFAGINWKGIKTLNYCYDELKNILIARNIKELNAHMNITHISGIKFAKRVGYEFFPSKYKDILLLRMIL